MTELAVRNPPLIPFIEAKLKQVMDEGFGEVVVKVKNGVVYRIVTTTDVLLCHDIDKDTKA